MTTTNIQVKRDTTELEKSENIDNQTSENKKITLSMSPEDRLTLRAKRFGATDKLQQRALRFGSTKDDNETGNTGGKSGGIGKIDKPSDEVLKKRAARFGITESSKKAGSISAGVECDEETLKKRAERFGVISESVKEIDSQEKLAKRQKRFGSLNV